MTEPLGTLPPKVQSDVEAVVVFGSGGGEGTRGAGPIVTMGVEEEFLLVEPRSGRTSPCADLVLARQRACCRLPDGASVQRELRATQIEAATGVCSTAPELREHLVAGRQVLAEAAAAEDCAIVASGTPITRPSSRKEPAADGRFRDIDETYRGLVDDYEACGCHVHIGVPDRDTAVAVVNHLSHWLPTLLALSANSPFDRGRDTGYQSWRMVLQSRFPGSGIAPHCADYREYRQVVDMLRECGTLVDDNQTFWLARPSPRFPTVELRVADTLLTVEETVLQALLSRALVRTALTAIESGREAEAVDAQMSAAAVWTASRNGLEGPAVDPVRRTPVPMTIMLTALLEHVRDALDETGDRDLVAGLVRTVQREGNGAARQREALQTGGQALHRLLVERSVPVGPVPGRRAPLS